MNDVIERLCAVAAATPDKAALVEGGRSVSYAEFLDLVRRLAGAIAAFGPHPKVAIHLPQGGGAYAAMYATLMAGGFYSPLNVDAPEIKRRSVCEQFAPDVIIGRPDAAEILQSTQPVIDPAAVSGPSLDRARPADDLAYVIFTSGSTGKPKGVAVPRSGLNHYVAWALDALELGPEDRCSQHPTIAFDVSVTDIFGALCAGATLFPLTDALDRLMPAQAIRRHKLTVWNSVPSVVNLMQGAGQITAEVLGTLRLMNFLGEPLLPDHLQALFAARPDLVIQNTYGPTEATVSMTELRLTADSWREACRATVSIGDAIPGMGLHLADGSTPDEGELVITGPQLARGYWHNEAATKAAFRPLALPDGDVAGYYTGDWAERHEGRIYFKWRRDFQVKVNGYRVELDEVNGALRGCGFSNALTSLVDGELTAFLEIPEETPVDVEALRVRLADALEPYAIPKQFIAAGEFPRNQNDKIDLPALVARYTSPKAPSP